MTGITTKTLKTLAMAALVAGSAASASAQATEQFFTIEIDEGRIGMVSKDITDIGAAGTNSGRDGGSASVDTGSKDDGRDGAGGSKDR